MKETSIDDATTQWRRTLPMLLAVPLASSAVLLAAWFIGGRQPLADTSGGALYSRVAASLSQTACAVTFLRRPSARSLVLPTPIMMWSLAMVQREPHISWLGLLVAEVACLVLLTACWRGDRRLGQLAAIGCGAVIVGLLVS